MVKIVLYPNHVPVGRNGVQILSYLEAFEFVGVDIIHIDF